MKEFTMFKKPEILRCGNPNGTEKYLIRRAKAGDQEAFSKLYDQYVGSIYRFIFTRVSEGMVAEDLTSQVFLKAWENIGQFQHQGIPLRAWLYRIARNTIIDHYRKDKAHECLEHIPIGKADPGVGVEEQLDFHLEEEELVGAMEQLTVEQRQAICLKFLEGLNNREVAYKMGKEVGAIRALQMRGLQTLAKILTTPEQKMNEL